MLLDNPGEPVVIPAQVRRAIEALGGDVDELRDRATAQITKGRRIGSLFRYLVQMAKTH